MDEAIKKVFEEMMAMSEDELQERVDELMDDPRTKAIHRAWNIDETDNSGE